jgi:hypothetical protein
MQACVQLPAHAQRWDGAALTAKRHQHTTPLQCTQRAGEAAGAATCTQDRPSNSEKHPRLKELGHVRRSVTGKPYNRGRSLSGWGSASIHAAPMKHEAWPMLLRQPHSVHCVASKTIDAKPRRKYLTRTLKLPLAGCHTLHTCTQPLPPPVIAAGAGLGAHTRCTPANLPAHVLPCSQCMGPASLQGKQSHGSIPLLHAGCTHGPKAHAAYCARPQQLHGGSPEATGHGPRQCNSLRSRHTGQAQDKAQPRSATAAACACQSTCPVSHYTCSGNSRDDSVGPTGSCVGPSSTSHNEQPAATVLPWTTPHAK